MSAENGGKGEFLERNRSTEVTVGKNSMSARAGDIVFKGKLPLELPRRYDVIYCAASSDVSPLFCTTFEDGVPLAGCDSIQIPVGSEIHLYRGKLPKSVRSAINTYIRGEY